MTKNVAMSVQQDITEQMEAVSELIEALKELHGGAGRLTDVEIRQLAQEMASQVRVVSERAYDLGEKFLERAA